MEGKMILQSQFYYAFYRNVLFHYHKGKEISNTKNLIEQFLLLKSLSFSLKYTFSPFFKNDFTVKQKCFFCLFAVAGVL